MPSDVVDQMQAEWRRLMPAEDFAALGVVHRILRSARLVLERSDEFLAAHGLTRGELDILSALYRSPDPLAPTTLAATLLAPPSAVTMRIKALERAGLIGRETSTQDRRSRPVRITDAGRELVEAVIPAQLRLETDLIAHLTHAQRDDLAGLLRRLTVPWEAERPAPNASERAGRDEKRPLTVEDA